MKKFLAIALAVLMTASFSVVGMAEDGIQPNGGGGFEQGPWVLHETATNKPYTLAEFNELHGTQTIKVEETLQLAVYNVSCNSDESEYTLAPYTGKTTWKSTDTSVATVSNTGLVTAVGTGNWNDGAAIIKVFCEEFSYVPIEIRVLEKGVTLDPAYENCETGVLPTDSAPDTPLFLGDWPTMRIGDTVQLALFYRDKNNLDGENKRYTGEVHWAVRDIGASDKDLITISDTGLLTVRAGWGSPGTESFVGVYATAPGIKLTNNYFFLNVLNEQGDNPVPPTTPNGTGSSDKSEPSPTENAANDDKTLDKLAAGEPAEVKLTSGSAALSTDTMDTLGGHGGTLTVTVDKMTVAIPGGFGKVTEPGRIYYPLDFSASPANADDAAAAVKGANAKTEVVKAGGDMVMPTTVTVTLKTRLTGTVRVYYYNPETRRYTLIASPTAQDGKITFATRQMGHLVLTTGTI